MFQKGEEDVWTSIKRIIMRQVHNQKERMGRRAKRKVEAAAAAADDAESLLPNEKTS